MIPEKAIKELRRKGKKRVFVQLPEGLKYKASEACSELREHGFECMVSGDACFGACDMRYFPGATTLHFGHSRMINDNSVYAEYRVKTHAKRLSTRGLPKRIALCTTVQHIGEIPLFKNLLSKNGRKVVIIPKGNRCAYPGQVLGCDLSGAEKVASKVDAFAFVGTGVFHAMGIAHATGKRVFAIDPYTGISQEINAERLAKESALRKTKAMNAESYGIVVSTKPGQRNMALARKLKRSLESKGKKAMIIAMGLITPDSLLPYRLGAYVITACPRIVVDDWRSYSMPLLLPHEI